MNTIVNKIAVSCLMMGMFSCSQNEELLIEKYSKNEYETKSGYVAEHHDDKMEMETDTLRFEYHGMKYKSLMFVGNGEIQIANRYVAYVYETLKEMSDVAIYMNADNSLTFYDSYESMREAIMLRNKKRPTTRFENIRGCYIKEFSLRVWRDAKGRTNGGPFYEWFSNGIQGERSPYPLSVSGSILQSVNMDNTISSCQMWIETAYCNSGVLADVGPNQFKHAVVTFYENDNYTGRSLTFSEMNISNTYSQRDYFSSFGFNDIASSIKVVYDNDI